MNKLINYIPPSQTHYRVCKSYLKLFLCCSFFMIFFGVLVFFFVLQLRLLCRSVKRAWFSGGCTLVLLLLFRVASFKSELYALISEKEKLAKYLRHCHIINWRKRKTGAALLAQLILVSMCVPQCIYIYVYMCVCVRSCSQKSHKFGMTAAFYSFSRSCGNKVFEEKHRENV